MLTFSLQNPLQNFESLFLKHFSIAQWRFIFHLYFSNQIEPDLKSIDQEFLLIFILLKKHSIQDFIIQLWIV